MTRHCCSPSGWPSPLRFCPVSAGTPLEEAQTIRLASTTSVDNSGLLARDPAAIHQGDRHRRACAGAGHGSGARHGAARRRRSRSRPRPRGRAEIHRRGSRRRTGGRSPGTISSLSGPESDPAQIKGGQDAVAAFKADCGGRGAVRLARRPQRHATRSNCGCGRRRQSDPKSGAGSWYREIGGGMGQALNAAVGDAGLYLVRPRHLAQLQEQGAARGRRRGRSDC